MVYTPSIDLATAAYRRLVAFPEFVALITDGLVGKDSDNTPWVFQGLDNEGRPFRDPEGSGKVVVVLADNEDWATKNPHNTASFPQLQVLVYADSKRDVKGAVTDQDAKSKVKDVFKVIDRCFHLIGHTEADQAWPGLRVHTSLASSPLSIMDVPGTQSYTKRGEKRYETTTD